MDYGGGCDCECVGVGDFCLGGELGGDGLGNGGRIARGMRMAYMNDCQGITMNISLYYVSWFKS